MNKFLVICISLFIVGCSVKTTTLPGRYIEGMAIHKLPNSDEAVFVPSDALVVCDDCHVFLESNRTTSASPPDGAFLAVYKSDDKYYVLCYGRERFKINRWTFRTGGTSIEKIAVIKDREKWASNLSLKDAFKEEGEPIQVVSVPSPEN